MVTAQTCVYTVATEWTNVRSVFKKKHREKILKRNTRRKHCSSDVNNNACITWSVGITYFCPLLISVRGCSEIPRWCSHVAYGEWPAVGLPQRVGSDRGDSDHRPGQRRLQLLAGTSVQHQQNLGGHQLRRLGPDRKHV